MKTTRLFLVEQNVIRLRGQYLTEALVVAATPADALRAAAALADPVTGWGLTVVAARLRVYELGPAPDPLPAGLVPRYNFGPSLLLVVGTGEDNDT